MNNKLTFAKSKVITRYNGLDYKIIGENPNGDALVAFLCEEDNERGEDVFHYIITSKEKLDELLEGKIDLYELGKTAISNYEILQDVFNNILNYKEVSKEEFESTYVNLKSDYSFKQ